jgi:Phosphodiester glycosidase
MVSTEVVAMSAKVRFALVLSAFASLTAVAVDADARPGRNAPVVNRWSDVRPGVRHLEHREGPFAYHLVTIALSTPGLTVRSTDEANALPSEGHHGGHRWTRTSTWARRTGADIAINGNYYDLTRWRSACGLAVSNGARWRSTYDDRRLNCFASAGFGEGGRAAVFDSRGLRKAGDIPGWMSVVVSGSPALLRDGELVGYRHPRHALYRNPRTAIGLSQDGSTLFLLVVDGREGSAQGMTCRESAKVLREHGAWNAINLDGGGSSALFIEREGGVVNHTGEVERPVVNHLGFFFDEQPSVVPSAITPAPAVGAPEKLDERGAPLHEDYSSVPERGMVRWTMVRIERLDPRRIGRRRVGDWTTLGSFVSMGVAGAFSSRRRRDEERE